MSYVRQHTAWLAAVSREEIAMRNLVAAFTHMKIRNDMTRIDWNDAAAEFCAAHRAIMGDES
jgi:hypothetical protein